MYRYAYSDLEADRAAVQRAYMRPYISGDIGVGNTLRCVVPAGWEHASYQWYRTGVAISGAISEYYTQTASDLGYTLECVAVPVGYRSTAVLVTGAAGPIAAVIANPLSDVAYTSKAIPIYFRADQGVVLDADHLTVLNEAGVEVPFQFEPATDPRTEADLSTWPDGSIKAGSLWVVVPTLAAGATAEYSIEVSATANGHSYTQNVVYSVTSGTAERLTASNKKHSFENDQAWNLRRIYDGAVSDEDYFQGVNGVSCELRVAGTTYSSFTSAHVSLISHGRIGSTAFGYGVAFQEWETVFSWTGLTSLTSRVRYRVWADGSVTVDAYHTTSSALSSATYYLVLLAAFPTSGVTATADAVPGYIRYEYSNKRALLVLRHVQTGSEVDPVADGNTAQNFAAARSEFGWSATAPAEAGAYWSASFDIVPGYASGDHANELLRRRNRPTAVATDLSADQLKSKLAGICGTLISRFTNWYPRQYDTQWLGCLATARLGLGVTSASYVAATEAYESWLTTNGYDGTTASWYSAYASGERGLEHTGRNLQALTTLYDAAEALGIAPNPWLSQVHDAADFFVQAETLSGADGRVRLHGNEADGDNFNAEATALAGLAKSLEITANTARQATFDRIWTRFKSGFEDRNRMPHHLPRTSTIQDSVLTPQAHYIVFQLYEALVAYKRLPGAMSGFTLRSSAFILEATTPSGKVWERQNSIYANRRGALSTNLYAAANLMLSPSPTRTELAHAAILLQYIIDNFDTDPNGLWASPVDGWGYTAGKLGQGMDVRALVECLPYLQ